MLNGSSIISFCITAFCNKQKVSYHFLHVWWFGNILYTIRKLSSRDLWGCMLYLCIFKFHLQKQGSSIIFFSIAAFCNKQKVCIIFCMSDGLATYYIPLESCLQDIFKGACFTCVFLSSTHKNKDHSSFSSISLHSTVIGRFRITFCLSDGLAAYYIPLESSLQWIFESACFTFLFLSFTGENKDHPSLSSVSLHSAVIRRSRITFCMSDGLATYYIPLQSSLQHIFECV